jgi:hypothetical protein
MEETIAPYRREADSNDCLFRVALDQTIRRRSVPEISGHAHALESSGRVKDLQRAKIRDGMIGVAVATLSRQRDLVRTLAVDRIRGKLALSAAHFALLTCSLFVLI